MLVSWLLLFYAVPLVASHKYSQACYKLPDASKDVQLAAMYKNENDQLKLRLAQLGANMQVEVGYVPNSETFGVTTQATSASMAKNAAQIIGTPAQPFPTTNVGAATASPADTESAKAAAGLDS